MVVLVMNDFYTDYFLYGIYQEAFDAYIEYTQFPEPENVDSPQVAIFLLVCDLALNPGRGFPFPITAYEEFINDVDPSTRFFNLCKAARKGLP